MGVRRGVVKNTIAYFAQKDVIKSLSVRKREELAKNVGVKDENFNIWRKTDHF